MSISGSLPDCPLVSLLPGSETESTDSTYLTGRSTAMQRVRSQIQRIAPYFRIALITGEPGTGKETVARFLHDRSAGASGPFVMWQAANFVEQLSADPDSTLLEEAQGGTLFLDDIRSVSYAQQPQLLRLLQQLGKRRQDVRVVASTTQELRPIIATGQFREDLYQRMAAVEIGMTPLRKRIEDIAGLAETLLRRKAVCGITADAITRLELHSWPENVRELLQVTERAAALAEGRVVETRHLALPEYTPALQAAPETLERLEDVIKRHVLDVLMRCSGNKLRASEVLGISRSTLYRMLEAGAPRPDTINGLTSTQAPLRNL